jgi:hypothetical protein
MVSIVYVDKIGSGLFVAHLRVQGGFTRIECYDSFDEMSHELMRSNELQPFWEQMLNDIWKKEK